MGVDAMLYFRGELSAPMLERVSDAATQIAGCGFVLHPAEAGIPTLTVWDTYSRLWAPGYRRGPWPVISAVIDLARAVSPDGEVFYHGDGTWYFEDNPFTREEQDNYWRSWAASHD